MVRRGHDDRIDVLARQEFVVIRSDEQIFAKDLPRADAPACVQIGDPHQRHARNVKRNVGVRRAPAAKTDDSELNPVVWRDRALSCGRGDVEKSPSGAGGHIFLKSLPYLRVPICRGGL